METAAELVAFVLGKQGELVLDEEDLVSFRRQKVIGADVKRLGSADAVAEWLNGKGYGVALGPASRIARALCEAFPTTDDGQDVAAAWMAVPITAVPAVQDLAGLLREPLRRPLTTQLRWDPTRGPAADVMVVGPDVVWHNQQLVMVRAAVLDIARVGESEDSLHYVVEVLVGHVLDLCALQATGCRFKRDRNRADSSGASVAAMRADFSVWLTNGILAFKGEESAHEQDLRVAKDELGAKMVVETAQVFFGGLQYQLGYAMGGMTIQFFAVSTVRRGNVTALTEVLDLRTIAGRSECVRTVVNIARVLVCIQNSFPRCLEVNSRVHLGDSSSVWITPLWARKLALAYTGPHLLELYRILLLRPVRCLVRPVDLPEITDNGLKLHLVPMGLTRIPRSEQEMFQSLRDVLCALQGLHALGWVHRDVRPENILFDVTRNEYVLFDLEWAERSNCPLGRFQPKASRLPPEVRAGGMWTPAGDLWQAGLLLSAPIGLSDVWRMLREGLQADDPGQRWTAEKAIACLNEELHR
jgi:hypothetical protein